MTQPQPPDFAAAFKSVANATLPPPPDPRILAERALKRDGRRTRLLAALSILFWSFGCTGMIVHVIALNRLVIFLRIAPGLPWNADLPGLPRPRDGYVDWGTNFIHHSTPWVVAAQICLMLAALCTVTLVLTSRRATLQRIHLTLTQLSEELKQRPIT